jgi:hypothetical protein
MTYVIGPFREKKIRVTTDYDFPPAIAAYVTNKKKVFLFEQIIQIPVCT